MQEKNSIAQKHTSFHKKQTSSRKEFPENLCVFVH